MISDFKSYIQPAIGIFRRGNGQENVNEKFHH